MRFLSDKEREVLKAFCDTIHPRGSDCANSPFQRSASDLRVVELVEQAVKDRDKDSRDRLRLMLRLLERRAVNGILAGHWAPFTQLDANQRNDVLLALANSNFNRIRGAFHGVKQLVSFLAYSVDREKQKNPFWQIYQYQGHAKCMPQSEDALPIQSIDSDQTLTCDVLVIGSGAGGAVAAAELAAAGQEVIVVEKGEYFSNSQLPATELDGMRFLYESRGTLRTVDRSMVILAGSTLGGGTTINWMTCLDPPEKLLYQWEREHGFSAATSVAFRQSIQQISQRVNVTRKESRPNFQNSALERGCHALGYSASVIARNVKDCVKCDFCSFGCRYGAKQDMRRTFLRDAVDHQARIIVRAHAERVTHENGVATGADLVVRGESGQLYDVRVKAKYVVCSAGAIHSPAILTRSGLTNRNIGANLFLHPVGAVFAKYAEPVEAWKGAPQTRLSEHFADLDGDGYGVRLEASPAHPGLWALGLPWQGGMPFQDLMQQVPQLANTIVLTRDRFAGRVKTNSKGMPELHYRLHPYDANHLLFGLEQAIRVHRAAGAETVFGPNNDCLSYDCKSGDEQGFEVYLQRLLDTRIRPNHLGLFCAHQMSSCRIGGSAALGVINPEGETFDVKNLFVIDGSSLPTSTGVNPMISILATSHHLAQHLKSRIAAPGVQ